MLPGLSIAAMAHAPAGWFPDPEHSGQQRYWDGQQWTGDRAPSPPAPPMAGAGPGADSTAQAGVKTDVCSMHGNNWSRNAQGEMVCTYCGQPAERPDIPTQGYLSVSLPGIGQHSMNGLALAALVSAFLVPVLPIILGHVALRQIRTSGEDGRGMAIAAIILGWGVLVLNAIVLIWFFSVWTV